MNTQTLDRSDLDIARSDAAYYAKVLLKLRQTLMLVQDNIEDEGDRSYFGSTNDADQLREVAQDIDALAWDRIMASSQPPVDLYAIIAEQRGRAEKAEAAVVGAVETLRQQKAWVNHWLDDHAHGLKPTKGSLRDALADITAAISKAEGK